MLSTASAQPTDSTQPNRGGLAPEERQCRYTMADGFHCRCWAVRGHQYCQKHARYMECPVDGPIEVPLMEDPSAVQLVATQTTRAVGWGQIPPANARAVFHGCRIVQNGFALELAEAKFRLKCHQLGLSPDQFFRTSASARVPHVSAVGDMGERVSAPSNDPQPVILSEARSAVSKDLHLTADASPLTAPPLSPNPLDDVPPPPRAKSACDPCVEALKQGADESLLDCKHCPAAIAGNLRAPQLPDPRNPPDPSYESEVETQPSKRPFPNLKTNWDHAIERFGGQCAGNRYPTRYPVQTDQEYAKELAAIRARPFDDILHARPASPPPPPPPPVPNLTSKATEENPAPA